MSVDFYGKKEDGTPIFLGLMEGLNMSLGNAACLLAILGMEVVDGGGEASVVDMRRGLMLAKARLPNLTGQDLHERSPAYLKRRLNDLSKTVERLAAMGAVIIYWA